MIGINLLMFRRFINRQLHVDLDSLTLILSEHLCFEAFVAKQKPATKSLSHEALTKFFTQIGNMFIQNINAL